ncbi:GNAT family N-acetyltransferase [Streptomyces pinistramenti]|uniref:GNAT family N-acetyltransferase n=1 Tax=Streptomyces pinistramenti TaxID=2884812 RepID=UPI001D06A4F4|nr:GNAT family N-acetyltransferase [Streptomyces pinistramenti]MCB5911191.1 GNAT family N-acetyltransferase [Streptomyces pinistramenti]
MDPAMAPPPAPPSELARLVGVWADGWARARRTAVPLAVPGGFRIEVGQPRHVARYVLPAADPDVLRELVRGIDAPGLWLKVCAPRERIEPLLPPGWQFSEPQYLMTAPLEPPGDLTPPPGYRLTVRHDADGGLIEARIVLDGTDPGARTSRTPHPAPTPRPVRTGSPEAGPEADPEMGPEIPPAASGLAALTGGASGAVPGPRSAVFDMIGTAAGHRRRGLGRLVMAALAARAAAAGATQGVLVASPEGRALYEALGWELRAPVTAAVRPR